MLNGELSLRRRRRVQFCFPLSRIEARRFRLFVILFARCGNGAAAEFSEVHRPAAFKDGFYSADPDAPSNLFQRLSRGGVADCSRNAKGCAERCGEEQTGNCGFEGEERQQEEVHWTTEQCFGARFDVN